MVVVHPIVIDVGLGGEVEVFVADGGNQLVEGLVFVAVLFVKLKQRDVDIRVVGVEFLDFLKGLQRFLFLSVFGVDLSQHAVIAHVLRVLLDEFLQFGYELLVVALTLVDVEALLGDDFAWPDLFFQQVHIGQGFVELSHTQVSVN